MTDWAIPFNRPARVERELEYVQAAVDEGWLAGDGRFTQRCEALLQEITRSARVMLTPSCTDALELSALLLDVEPGDEVVVPSFAFPSAASAFALRGAKIVFADIREDTWNLDEALLAEHLSARTKVVVALHYGGVACDMSVIGPLAATHGAHVVEDNAHGLFATVDGRPLGSFGAFATQSFHETKNVTCGEGGALVINDERFVERAEILREKGTNRKRFFRGQVDKYTWVDVGSSFLLSELAAAFLAAQLEEAASLQHARHRIWSAYADQLADWSDRIGVRFQAVPANCVHAAHVFGVLMPDAESRARLIDALRAEGILAVFHYLPLHLSEVGRQHGGREGLCPVTESVSERLVRLPLFAQLTEAEQQRVVDVVRASM